MSLLFDNKYYVIDKKCKKDEETNILLKTIQDLKDEIVLSVKNEIILLKQEIVNLNREKDEEINILKQELLKTKQELEQSQNDKIICENKIIELEKENNKLIEQIPRNLPKNAEKETYEELMENCLGLHYLNKFDTRHIQQINDIHSIVKNIMDDDDEYIIADKSSLDNYKLLDHYDPRMCLIGEKSNFIITNKGKVFIKYDDSDYYQNGNYIRDGYYYFDFDIKCMNNQLIHLLISSMLRPHNFYDDRFRHLHKKPVLKQMMDDYCDNKN